MAEQGTDPWTIKRLLTWTAEYLAKKGAESPRLDAEVLLANSLQCARIDLYARFDEVPGEPELSAFRGVVKQRAEGTPVAYLVGYREFFSLRCEVNRDVLIPRPETEFVVLEGIDFCRQREALGKPAASVVDVGTGSGCIALSLAHHLPEVEMHAIDCSVGALSVARRNSEALKLSERLQFWESDLFLSVPEEKKFDLIVSNPPYIGRAEQGTVDPSVAQHEPELALYGGEDGMEIIHRLVADSLKRLTPGGALIWELSPYIAAACEELVQQTDGIEWLGLVNDLDGQPRVAKARRT